MALENLGNGLLAPSPETRGEYAQEIHAFIELTIFRGRAKMQAVVGGQQVTVLLPSAVEILDFITLQKADTPDCIDVAVRLPIDGNSDTFHNITVRYSPLLN